MILFFSLEERFHNKTGYSRLKEVGAMETLFASGFLGLWI